MVFQGSEEHVLPKEKPDRPLFFKSTIAIFISDDDMGILCLSLMPLSPTYKMDILLLIARLYHCSLV